MHAGVRLLSALCAAPHLAVLLSGAVAGLLGTPASDDATSGHGLWVQSLRVRVRRGPMRCQLRPPTAAQIPCTLPLLPVQTELGLKIAAQHLALSLRATEGANAAAAEASETVVPPVQSTIEAVRRAGATGRLVHLAATSIAATEAVSTASSVLEGSNAPASIRHAAALCARDLPAAAATALQAKICLAHARLKRQGVDWRVSVVLSLAARVGKEMPLTAIGSDIVTDHQKILHQSLAVDEVRDVINSSLLIFVWSCRLRLA